MKTSLKKKFIPHFNLQPIKGGKEAYLIMQISCTDTRFKYSLKIPAFKLDKRLRLWNEDKKKLGVNAPSSWHDRVREVEGWVRQFVEGKEEVLSIDLINHLRKSDGGEELPVPHIVDNKPNFFEEVEKIISDAEKGIILNPKGKSKYSSGTLICWTKTMNKLKEYFPELTFDATISDYDMFVLKCQSAGLSNSYIGALIKDWKTIMKHAAKKGLHNNLMYKSKDFKQITEDPSTQVFLTLDEIQALKEVELTGMQDEIRDMFLFDCSIGIRISDMEVFNESAIINETLGIATLVTKKTGEEICVDLKEDYFKLKKKYGGKLPELYHRNVINREIKDIAEKAGITSLVKVISMKGGKTEVKNIKKCLLIKNHTARRTFITHSLKHDDALTVAAQAGITLPTLRKSYDLRSKTDITIASRERRLKREAEVSKPEDVAA